MDILLGVIIGTVYGRNAKVINERAYRDVRRMVLLFSGTQFAATTYYMAETIYLAIERKTMHKEIYTHDILCECNRRTCKPISINTYVRKIKALN